MWNLGNFTYQLGDAFEKVRKEVESFGVVEETVLTEEESLPTETRREVQNTRDKTPESSTHPANEESLVSVQIKSNKDESCSIQLLVHGEKIESKEFRLLRIREQQLQEQSMKLLHLQERNEFLEKSALSISKEDFEAKCLQYEERLQNAENSIYTLSKERDSLLQKSTDNDDYAVALKEKDEMIEEIMAEGQRLSKKQLELENAIRKKSARIKDVEGENEDLRSKLMTELSKCEQLSLEKLQLTQNIQQQDENYKKQLDLERSKLDTYIKENSAAKVQAENEAKQAAREGLLKRVTDAEEKCSALMSHIEQLESEIETQNQRSEEIESKSTKELALLEIKCRETEIQHEELLAKFPEATQPLLQQLDALQSILDSKTEDWGLIERSLMEQLDLANRDAQTAQQKEQILNRKLETLNEKFLLLNQAYEQTKNEFKMCKDHTEELKRDLERAEETHNSVEKQFSDHMSTTEKWKVDQQLLEEKLQSTLTSERTKRMSTEMQLKQLQIEHQKKIADLEDSLRKQKDVISLNCQMQKSMDENSVASEPANSAELVSSKSLQYARDHHLDRLNKQVKSLEDTRDHLSGELVSVTQRAIKAESSLADYEAMKKELAELQSRYSSAIELLGEKEEQVEEIKADLEDFKQMYKDQIAYVAEQLSSKS